jgi:hypothetical protein
MKHEELRELLTTLREFGVKEYQTDDIKLSLGEAPPPPLTVEQIKERTEIKMNAQKINDVLKLPDNELINNLFPVASDDLGIMAV